MTSIKDVLANLPCNEINATDEFCITPGELICGDVRKTVEGGEPLSQLEIPADGYTPSNMLRVVCLHCPALLRVLADHGKNVEDIPESYIKK